MIWTALTVARGFLAKIPWQLYGIAALIAVAWFYGNHRYAEGVEDERAERDKVIAAAVLKAVEAEREAQAAHDTREAARHTHTQELREAAQAAPEGGRVKAVLDMLREAQ